MDDEHRIEIEVVDDESSDNEGAETVSEEGVDISAAIDEAVNAVEAAAQRRGDTSPENAPEAATVADHAGNPGGGSPAEVERLQAEVDTLRDHSLRTLADFDNYRKRIERERGQERKYASVELLREVLGIVDNLERALSAEGSLDDLKQGVQMILRQMDDVLERAGVTRVEALGQEFDPALHEAVSRVEDPEVEYATVIEEFQPGYVVHERLLRPSIVRVAMPAGKVSSGGDQQTGTEEAAN